MSISVTTPASTTIEVEIGGLLSATYTAGTGITITAGVISATGGGGTWGTITGTLSAQTDLAAALSLKAPLESPSFTGTDINIGMRVVADLSTGANISSTNGVHHAVFGDTGIDRSFVARVKGAFGWIRGAFTGRIHPPDTLTADRTYTLPDASGTIALASDITAAAIATALGVPTYADLTAANAALAIGQPYYDTALSKLQITTA